jgi:hypothetical protein
MVPGQTRHDTNRIYDLTEETKSVQAPIDTNPDPVRKLALLNAEMLRYELDFSTISSVSRLR